MTKPFKSRELVDMSQSQFLAYTIARLVRERMDLVKELYPNALNENYRKGAMKHDLWVEAKCLDYLRPFLEGDDEDNSECESCEEGDLKFSIKDFSEYLNVGFRMPLPERNERIDHDIRGACREFLKSEGLCDSSEEDLEASSRDSSRASSETSRISSIVSLEESSRSPSR